jgi:hypothetical protein
MPGNFFPGVERDGPSADISDRPDMSGRVRSVRQHAGRNLAILTTCCVPGAEIFSGEREGWGAAKKTSSVPPGCGGARAFPLVARGEGEGPGRAVERRTGSWLRSLARALWVSRSTHLRGSTAAWRKVELGCSAQPDMRCNLGATALPKRTNREYKGMCIWLCVVWTLCRPDGSLSVTAVLPSARGWRNGRATKEHNVNVHYRR